jgi:hypothetical protein
VNPTGHTGGSAARLLHMSAYQTRNQRCSLATVFCANCRQYFPGALMRQYCGRVTTFQRAPSRAAGVICWGFVGCMEDSKGDFGGFQKIRGCLGSAHNAHTATTLRWTHFMFMDAPRIHESREAAKPRSREVCLCECVCVCARSQTVLDRRG